MHRSNASLTFAVIAALSLALSGCGKGDHDHKDHDYKDHGHKDDDAHSHPPPRGGIMIELGDHEYQVEFKIQKDLDVFTMWIMDGHAEDPVRIAAPKVEMVVSQPDAVSRKFSAESAFGGPPGSDPIIEEPFTITFSPIANENTGEKVGDTSQFDAPLAELKDLTKFNGTIATLTIRGKTFKDVKLAYDHAKVKQ